MSNDIIEKQLKITSPKKSSGLVAKMTTHYQISDDEEENERNRRKKDGFKKTVEQIEEIKSPKNINDYDQDYEENNDRKMKKRKAKARKVNKSKRDSSNSERGSDEENEGKRRNNMFFMKYYKNLILK